MTKRIYVGDVPIGGDSPVSIQSMTNTKTSDVNATVSQIMRLEEAGCEIVRVAVPDMESAEAIAEIREQINLPLVADIHFDYRLALKAVESGADKIRINPGNIGGEDRVKLVADACRRAGIPIRIGVNSGSIESELLEKYGVSSEAMLQSAMRHVRLLNKYDFDDICISVKSSDVSLTVAAYRLLSRETDYPLHLGVTESGTAYMGTVKSAVGLGALLLDGIGDTIRVSLTDDPVEEIRAAKAILKAAGVRKEGINFISCPSCGRCQMDLIKTAKEVEDRLRDSHMNITVAVMGCAVNGPGEAKEADYGIAGGSDSGLIFKKGEIVEKTDSSNLVDRLISAINDGEKSGY